jgi:hypothetical protein
VSDKAAIWFIAGALIADCRAGTDVEPGRIGGVEEAIRWVSLTGRLRYLVRRSEQVGQKMKAILDHAAILQKRKRRWKLWLTLLCPFRLRKVKGVARV